MDESTQQFLDVLPLLVSGSAARIPANWLWSTYQDWCRRSAKPVANRRQLSAALTGAGAVRIKSSTIVYDLTPIVGGQ